ncbi:MAG: glycosyltransferase family 2 protein [Acidobacteriota bacterium]
MSVRVAAVIPHWNRASLLKSFLAELPKQTRPFDRVIVVDNGSTDGSPEVAERGAAEVIRLPQNLGFAVAVNRGIAAAADCEWVAILNNDVTLDPTWLERLFQAAANAPFATGKILTARDHSIVDGTWDEIARSGCAQRCGSGSFDGAFWNKSRQIRICSMTAALFRRDLFDKLGPLDERFGSYLEDADFGVRCAKAGQAGVYEPAAVAYHQGSLTWGRWNSDTVRMLARNQILLTAKHFAGQDRWPILAGQLLWGIVAARHGCFGAWLEGRRAGKRLAAEIAGETVDPLAFSEILRASEAEILRTQTNDIYWRLYSWLAPLS